MPDNKELRGFIIDIDYILRDSRSAIRITFKAEDGRKHILLDKNFLPYFYLIPSNSGLDGNTITGIRILGDAGEEITPHSVKKEKVNIAGRDANSFRVTMLNPRHVTAMSKTFREFGECYEHDILFWKRYLIDKDISPLSPISVIYSEEDGENAIHEIRNIKDPIALNLSHLCFDIETYNPIGVPRKDRDPAIMISYANDDVKAVIASRKINEQFVKAVDDEKGLIDEFVRAVKEIDPDVIAGYNSSNFDLPYLQERSSRTKAEFGINRIGGEVRGEHHGLIDAFRIPGRINEDVYNVAKFVSVVGAAEQLIKVNSFKLGDVYNAVTGNKKVTVDKPNIWKLWDESDETREELARYSLSDAVTLNELYRFFLPLEVEMARVSGTTLGETTISTTGQLVEYTMMRYAHSHGQIIPNKPGEREIDARAANPFEGAYVRTPEAGIYDDIVVFDFKGLYPSIIISHNIDLSTVCDDCDDAYEAPDGTRFRKEPMGIMPIVLKKLLEERNEVKKQHRKNPEDRNLAARYQALKILANSFYGYLGYARSRWYSRKCASSVTALGRKYITMTMDEAEKLGFKVCYGDTDSLFILLSGKTKEDATRFMERINKALPEGMELELEDFYKRGIFVGKRGGEGGAKKKYALLSESGKIKIKGFELVRRDWAKITKETQRSVLETILKEGDKEKAVNIVKSVISDLKDGKVNIQELVMHTQLRKGLGSYDVKSPELMAARKAVEAGVRKRSEMEGAVIGYVITAHGDSVSSKARIEQMATDYDPDYYINHQIIPATMKILKELGYNADELKTKGSQKKL